MVVLLGLIGLLSVAAPQDGDVANAFAHYEAIRVALAGDRMTDVPKHAAELAPVAAKIASVEAKAAAEALGAAKDIKAAREQFGKLSAALLPAFEKAKLAGVQFYTCSMVNQSWAQKGKGIENPYYGKSMLTCGTPKK